MLLISSRSTNLQLDVNFVVCQLCALISAFWFRLFLHPSKTSPFIRHVVATVLGLYFALFCFGWYALHFLLQSGLTYGIMILTGVEHMHKYCLVVALSYLSLCQITRVYVFDYGMYSADFTGPMMVITQKITSLAFEIHDGELLLLILPNLPDRHRCHAGGQSGEMMDGWMDG
uniref:Membrane bound O-acyltransferase domain containing 2b n=1 Tax=Poecilia reticulata TaxID=8081 RepID=A0A3P9N7E8_POERE